jgi:site-specific recombinase XerD
MAGLELCKLAQHYAQSNAADGKSPITIHGYTYNISLYVRYLAKMGVPALLSSLRLDLARDFVLHEQARGMSPYSVQDEVRALKAFASWLVRENYSLDNALANLKLPKAPQTLIEILTAAEIDLLIKYQNPLTGYGSRDISILASLLDSGIRLSELCNLDLPDAHLEDGYFKVMGKGAKERLVPIGSGAQKMLWRYVIHFRPQPSPGNNRLFLTIDGEPLSANAVKHMLKAWGKAAGVPRLHAHLCRHTFATNFLTSNCGDVFRLQQILGHTTLEMVRRYVHLASAQAMVKGRPASPLDRMGLETLRGYKVDRMLNDRRRPGNRYGNHRPKEEGRNRWPNN